LALDSALNPSARTDRLHKVKTDQRSAGQRDRDRVLYASGFGRLAAITQVVSPTEGHVIHNRLTHSLEAAQIARRLAERLLDEQADLVQEAGGIDPDVVEAATLAHDMGHPPFGHVAEDELDELVRAHGLDEGFEGNAQSFRIITRLAAHRKAYAGLNLTRATLNAVLKYPWLHSTRPPDKTKFGAYTSDADAFAFAREGYPPAKLSVEAQIMDFADGLAYSIHDFHDFYRAGLIRLGRVLNDEKAWRDFTTSWSKDRKIDLSKITSHETTLRNMLGWIYYQPASGRPLHISLRFWSGQRIGDWIMIPKIVLDPQVGHPALEYDLKIRLQMQLLQRIVWEQVISHPRLAVIQTGQRRIIRGLFDFYLEAIRNRPDVENRNLLPPRFLYDLDQLLPKKGSAEKKKPRPEEVRLAADVVSSFTDAQAAALYRRVTGTIDSAFADVTQTVM
jgi:dGTPase